jgi:hypothetical protein
MSGREQCEYALHRADTREIAMNLMITAALSVEELESASGIRLARARAT